MSNYKHGNWYCKPANEEEAREIVERAVASGAGLHETVGEGVGCAYRWDFCGAWGVLKGRTYTGYFSIGEPFEHATEYTITQIRELFPLPGEQLAGWDGKWLPPAGTVCEVKFNGEWHETYIVGYSRDGSAVYDCRDFNPPHMYDGCPSKDQFRPLRTERERFVDAASAVFHGACMHDYSGQHFAIAMGAVYDAIKSGDLKAPE